MKSTSFLGVSSRSLVGLHRRPFNFSFFSITGWGIDLDYCNIEWFALEMNRDHSVIFEMASKYYIKQNSAYQISLKDTTWDKVLRALWHMAGCCLKVAKKKKEMKKLHHLCTRKLEAMNSASIHCSPHSSRKAEGQNTHFFSDQQG